MNTEREFFLGRTADRSRVYAEMRLDHKTGDPSETIEHNTVTDYYDLGISWTVYAPRDRRDNPSSAGQTPPEDRVIVDRTGADISADDSRLIEQYWLDWHLNALRAGCVHMTELDPPEGAEVPTRYGAPDITGWRLDNLICPETGYRYGTKWLLAALPDDVVANVQRILATDDENSEAE